MPEEKKSSRWAYSVWWPKAEIVITGIVVGGLVGFVVWFMQGIIVGAVIPYYGLASFVSAVPAVLIGGCSGWIASVQKMGWHSGPCHDRVAIGRFKRYRVAVAMIRGAVVFCLVHLVLGLIAAMAAWGVSWDRFESETMYEVYFGLVWLGVLVVSGLLGLREYLRRRTLVINETDALLADLES